MAFEPVQTSYPSDPGVAYPGDRAISRVSDKIRPYLARGPVLAGYGLFMPDEGDQGAYPTQVGQCYHQPTPGAAADVDAIITTTATAATDTTYTASVGAAVGSGALQPARKITFVLSSHADWDATTAVLKYYVAGRLVTENMTIPNGGNTTLTSLQESTGFHSLFIPAQSGTGGSFTVGVEALTTLTAQLFLGVGIRQRTKSSFDPNALYAYPGVSLSSPAFHYADGDTVPLMCGGEIYVFTEEATKDRDPVYVRIAAGAGGSVLGAFRNDADSASCVLVAGARFTRTMAAGVGRLDLSGVY